MQGHIAGRLICWIGVVMVGVVGCYPSEPKVDIRPPARPELTNITGMKMLHIRPGSFRMGSPSDEPQRELDEVLHKVTISRDFYMGQTEVTRAQFAMFINETSYVTEAERAGDFRTWKNPGIVQNDTHPVVCVTWNDARAFCAWLTRKEGKTYRLPTEAEWEYVARAGTTTPFNIGKVIHTNQANYNGTTAYPGGQVGEDRQSTTPVGTFAANPWGLYDMVGNVWEWCNDWYGLYPAGDLVDPKGPGSGSTRLSRGGSWLNAPEYCRSAYRYSGTPSGRYTSVGFRCVMER